MRKPVKDRQGRTGDVGSTPTPSLGWERTDMGDDGGET